MMGKRFFSLLVAVILTVPVYALDWRSAHARSANTELDAAIERVRKNNAAIDDYYLLALTYLNENEPDKALIVFNEVLVKDPQAYEARWGLAEVAVRRGDLEAGAKVFAEIISEHPDFIPAWISLAYVDFSRKDYSKALNTVTKVLEMGKDQTGEENYTRAYLVFAAIRGMMAAQGDSRVDYVYSQVPLLPYGAAKRLIPGSSQMYYGLGAFFLLSPACVGGDIDRAETYLKRAIDIGQDLAWPYACMAMVQKVRGDQKGYEAYLKKALKADDGNSLALFLKENSGNFVCITRENRV